MCCIASVAAEGAAWAQVPVPDIAAVRAELEALRADYQAKLGALEARLAALETGAATAAVPPPQPPPPAAGPGQTSSYFNPAMAVIGNFIGVGGHNDVDPGRAMNLEEAEIGLQAVIDPYARADIFLAFGDEGAEIEEGYVTFTALPWICWVKVGRMKGASARSTRCTRIRCRGPTSRCRSSICSAARRAGSATAFQWRD